MEPSYEDLFLRMIKAAESDEGIQINEEEANLLILKLLETIKSMDTINSRYKQALEFYALSANYAYSPIDDDIPNVNKDRGKIAKKALKGGDDE